VPRELWKVAFERNVLSKHAYDMITAGVFDCVKALEDSEHILKSRDYLIKSMKLPTNTVDVIGQRFYDARDTVANFLDRKLEETNDQLTIYINHGI
jgi:hypothetical protein